MKKSRIDHLSYVDSFREWILIKSQQKTNTWEAENDSETVKKNQPIKTFFQRNQVRGEIPFYSLNLPGSVHGWRWGIKWSNKWRELNLNFLAPRVLV